MSHGLYKVQEFVFSSVRGWSFGLIGCCLLSVMLKARSSETLTWGKRNLTKITEVGLSANFPLPLVVYYQKIPWEGQVTFSHKRYDILYGTVFTHKTWDNSFFCPTRILTITILCTVFNMAFEVCWDFNICNESVPKRKLLRDYRDRIRSLKSATIKWTFLLK